jgi:hypothetical protein
MVSESHGHSLDGIDWVRRSRESDSGKILCSIVGWGVDYDLRPDLLVGAARLTILRADELVVHYTLVKKRTSMCG